MALTRVRARLGNEWVDLTYNESTGRYEGYLTPTGTSFHQPGRYFPVAVEAVNDGGDVAQLDGSIFPALRLTVRETAAPTLRLVSPPNGYLTTSDPVFIFEATDEDGGSGVDPLTFSPAGAATEEIPDGYRFTVKGIRWEDGSHTLTSSVADYDGNVSTVSGAWIVDTIPPDLYLKTPFLRHVVDDESVLISGTATDVNGVTVFVNGKAVGGETFAVDVPLDVGENHITVTARDGAGWETSEEVYMIRLITDRTKADVDEVRGFFDKPVDQWSEAQLERFPAAILWGAYTKAAMNRVGIAVRFLAEELRKRGYDPKVSPKTDWTRQDATTRIQGETYRKNVETIRDTQNLKRLTEWYEIPETLRYLDYQGANQLEKALVETDAVFPRYTAWTSGEIFCGE